MGEDLHTVMLDLGGHEVPMQVRRSPRARRVAIRIDDKGIDSGEAGDCDGVTLVLPPGATVDQGVQFAQSKAVWIANRLSALPQRVAFTDGAEIPYLGTPHRIHHWTKSDGPARRGVAWIEDGAICVKGAPEHLVRRLTDWLKREARREIETRVLDKTAQPGKAAKRIRVTDTRSRWGSCSSTGTLSFSWRLIFAPAAVLDYVVAHEVGHLAEMNHSARFWATVDQLTGDMEKSRGWLKRHGTRLHRIG